MAAGLHSRFRHGRHRRGGQHGGRIALAAVFGVVAVITAVVAAYLARGASRSSAAPEPTVGVTASSASVSGPADSTPPPSATGRTQTGRTQTGRTQTGRTQTDHTPAGRTPSGDRHTADRSTRHATLTPDGMWWGVDSSGPITANSIRNVADWYRGARPQFWGRYLMGSYAVSRSELALARRQHIFVYLIVNDRNCSGCSGGDACGNDITTSQAHSDAQDAIRAAERLGVPAGAVLFKDIEQVSSCRGEPTPDYLLGWYRTLRPTRYRTGFYGNTFRPYYDFPVGYCAAVRASARFAADVVLDMNEPEPRLGAPRGTTGPHNAPPFAPSQPNCTPKGATVIWQYGESIDPDNLTDIDMAVPDTRGFLAPDGSVS